MRPVRHDEQVAPAADVPELSPSACSSAQLCELFLDVVESEDEFDGIRPNAVDAIPFSAGSTEDASITFVELSPTAIPGYPLQDNAATCSADAARAAIPLLEPPLPGAVTLAKKHQKRHHVRIVITPNPLVEASEDDLALKEQLSILDLFPEFQDAQSPAFHPTQFNSALHAQQYQDQLSPISYHDHQISPVSTYPMSNGVIWSLPQAPPFQYPANNMYPAAPMAPFYYQRGYAIPPPPAPFVMKAPPMQRKATPSASSYSGNSCFNCTNEDTPLWRRSGDGELV
jgi:hypothetical protein